MGGRWDRGFSHHSKRILHPRTTVTAGVLADRSAACMKEHFQALRTK